MIINILNLLTKMPVFSLREVTGGNYGNSYGHIWGNLIRRLSRRLNVCINADVTVGSAYYTGFIGNLSENGIYMRISTADSDINFLPGTIVGMEIKMSNAKTINIRCKIVWAYEVPGRNAACKSAYRLGMEVVDVPVEYKEYYNRLAINDLRKYLQQFGFILNSE